MSISSPGRVLRELVADSTIQVPGVFNALVARLAQQAGFDAIYLSGAAFSAGALAMPDVGLFTLSELTAETARLCRSVDLPLIVDADTGFGEAIHLERTVRELEVAGAAAIQIEDQRWPKRCGHLSGKTLIEPAEMCAKIRAAAGARVDSSLVIIARTDARGVDSLDDAISRAKMYLDAGADWIFPEALADREEFEKFADEIDVPLIANMTEFGKSPLLSLDELADLGYAVVLYPVTMLRVAMKAVEAAMAVIGSEGTQSSLLDLMQTRQELYDLLEYTDYERRDQHYFSGDGELPPSADSNGHN